MKFCQYKFTSGPSISLTCGQPLIATCDRSKASRRVRWDGDSNERKTMAVYPEASEDEQSDMCFYHQKKEKRGWIGKET